ncbi:MAG: hypothetical protein M0Z30_01910 [Actinomycetota bacterium]|nr:hypothetical protein [Actinomycetota bacterium]
MSENDRLRIELAAARDEIRRLMEENERLRSARTESVSVSAHRSQRAPMLFQVHDDSLPRVNSASGPTEKIALFRSLFSGRTDVFAQRWENATTGKSGWSPATLDGQWSRTPRRYTTLDDSVVADHLSGRITAGVYPLIDGDRCCFLACDFDKGSWHLDALAYLEVCRDSGVPACLERSRGGVLLAGGSRV